MLSDYTEMAERIRPVAARWRIRDAVLCTFTAWIVALTGLVSAQAQSPPRPSSDAAVVLVLDGSGSMWNKLGRDVKAYMVRDVVKKALPAAGSLSLGLSTFGHRRGGDCSDTEIVTQPNLNEQDRMIAFLDKFNPRGKGPVAAALRQAGDTLQVQQSTRRTVILVADNADNCRVDACATARELKQRMPDLTAHVIALGVPREEIPQLACIASETGGKLFEPDGAPGFADALDTAFKLSAGTPPLATLVQPVPVVVTVPAPTVAPSRPGLRLTAHLGPGQPALTDGVKWRVLSATNAPGTSNIVYEGTEPQPWIEVAPGTYSVEARFGLASARQSVMVRPEQSEMANIILNAGRIVVRAGGSAVPGGQNPQGSLQASEKPLYTLYRALAPDAASGSAAGPGVRAPQQRTIAMSNDASPVFDVPEGQYVVLVQQGLTRKEQRVAIAPGQAVDVDLALYLGELTLMATAVEGGAPLERVFFMIAEDDPESPAGFRQIASSGAAQPEFTLPAGTYTVIARDGDAEARARVTVKPGVRLAKSIVTGSSGVTLSTRIAGKQPASPDLIWYSVEPMAPPPTPNRPRATRTSVAEPTLTLAAGRYRVEGYYGDANVSVRREIDLRPGAMSTIALDHDAGQVHLAPKGANGAGLLDVSLFWEVVDQQRRTVWTTSRTRPVVMLASGRYTARVQVAGAWSEQPFKISAGDDITVEVTLK